MRAACGQFAKEGAPVAPQHSRRHTHTQTHNIQQQLRNQGSRHTCLQRPPQPHALAQDDLSRARRHSVVCVCVWRTPHAGVTTKTTKCALLVWVDLPRCARVLLLGSGLDRRRRRLRLRRCRSVNNLTARTRRAPLVAA